VDQTLFAVVMEVYLHGVSTREVDDLVRALGADDATAKTPAEVRAMSRPTVRSTTAQVLLGSPRPSHSVVGYWDTKILNRAI
jgi:transposase-like protein